MAELRGGLVFVLALCCLVGDAKHGPDLGPLSVRPSGRPEGLCELGVDVLTLIDQLGDRSQGLRISHSQLVGLHLVGPLFERRCSFGAGSGHGVHQPLSNLDRAGMAWITAVPSSSVTTLTSNGTPLVEGPMNIVRAGSCVSKALQW